MQPNITQYFRMTKEVPKIEDLPANISIQEFVNKRKYNIDHLFVDKVFNNMRDNIPILLDDKMIRWCGYEGKIRRAKERMRNTLKSNNLLYIDKTYKELTCHGEQWQVENENMEPRILKITSFILMMPEEFKKLCMILQTEKGKQIRQYYLEVEKILKDYAEHQKYHKNKRLQSSNTKQITLYKPQKKKNKQLDIETSKKFCNIMVSPLSCIYLLNIGCVENLRESMNIPIKYQDEELVKKYGFSENFKDRYTIKNIYSKIKGSDVTVEKIAWVDKKYLTEAEQQIRTFVNQQNIQLPFENQKELFVISPDKIQFLLQKFVEIGTKYYLQVEKMQAELHAKDQEMRIKVLETEAAKDKIISEKKDIIAEKKDIIAQKDAIIYKLETKIRELEMKQKDETIKQLQTQLNKSNCVEKKTTEVKTNPEKLSMQREIKNNEIKTNKVKTNKVKTTEVKTNKVKTIEVKTNPEKPAIQDAKRKAPRKRRKKRMDRPKMPEEISVTKFLKDFIYLKNISTKNDDQKYIGSYAKNKIFIVKYFLYELYETYCSTNTLNKREFYDYMFANFRDIITDAKIQRNKKRYRGYIIHLPGLNERVSPHIKFVNCHK